MTFVIGDAFSGQGGACKGYQNAGFDRVLGCDNAETPIGTPKHAKYYPGEYHHGDAIAFIKEYNDKVDAWHASPPCHRYSRGTAGIDRSKYPDLIAETREALQATGKPYILENVYDARYLLREPFMLCGRMFNLHAWDDDGTRLVMDRHRMFETNFWVDVPKHPIHGNEWVGGSYGGARRDKHDAKHVRAGGYVPHIYVQKELLGIDWMTQQGMYLSIPPVYSEYIGRQLLAQLETGHVEMVTL